MTRCTDQWPQPAVIFFVLAPGVVTGLVLVADRLAGATPAAALGLDTTAGGWRGAAGRRRGRPGGCVRAFRDRGCRHSRAGRADPAAGRRRAPRYVRNPMYLAVVATIVGQALALGQPALLGHAVAVGAAMVAFVPRLRGGPTLAGQFGAQYEAYRRAVPAWWPRPRQPGQTNQP